MPDPRFCSHCGAALNPGARFCSTCGKQLEAASPPQAQPTPGAPQECILGVIPGANRRCGLMGLKVESFVMVLTNLRVIFAAQSAQMMQENVQRAREAAKQEGKGFFGQWGAQFGANSGQHYFQMAPQQVLAEQPANFYYNINQIRKIKLWESQGDEDSTSTYYMEFDTTGGKQRFDFGQLDIRKLKMQLSQMYGSIVR